MSHKTEISGSEKIAVFVEKYLRGEDSLNHLAALLDVWSSVRQWLQTYQSLGPNGLLQTSQNASYSGIKE
ncbi:helix-turn-helix domain-containing protein [Paenibacillus larvae]|nr:helix-turn-helix domain-containing protein [Paenibacillus larvae]MDT2261603.1 helix-turn-helix domain-containing protein [Paenibacillus larvae]